MGDMTLIPTGGNVGADAGAAGIGGLIGAGLGSMLGNGGWVMSVMTTGRLSTQQVETAKRIIVKALAVIEKQQPPDD